MLENKNNESGNATSFEKRGKKKILVLIAAVLAICIVTATTVYAVQYIKAQTETVVDIFKRAEVACSVTQTNVTQTEIKFTIKNDSNVSVYLRVWIDPNWVKDDANYYTDPNFSISETANWTQQTDGYYLYSGKIEPEDTATITVSSTSAAPSGYTFDVNLMAEVIQSDPIKAVNEAWGYNIQ